MLILLVKTGRFLPELQINNNFKLVKTI